MGNEQSHLSSIEIAEKAVEVADFWSLYAANTFHLEDATNLSVFVGDLLVSDAQWSPNNPLERSAKNLMVYRHPCIIKYVSSWQKNAKIYLVVEEVTPLSHLIQTLNTLQICIGLHSILKALEFLHSKALSSHNNVCCSSIYVTKDGSWKLGGMEYLCKYKDLTAEFLSKSSSRYTKAIDPNETKHVINNLGRKDFVDVYSFSVLVLDILGKHHSDEVPLLSEFINYCKNELQSPELTIRPTFNNIIKHEFFNNEFINIHSFLTVLPLKSEEEKKTFFSSLGESLKKFDEVTVASQLSGLLLSRMVLINKSAQDNVLPLLLSPRVDKQESSETSLFSKETFRKYLTPKLLDIFSVRDAQIRLLLLNNFHNFMHTFTKEELMSCVLGELLVGIKDTNDHLVSATLKTLAELVPILGAATVIGGKRAKLFNDGTPTNQLLGIPKNYKPQKSVHFSTPVSRILQENHRLSLGSSAEVNILPERPSPDGEEGELNTGEIKDSGNDASFTNWANWDENTNTGDFSNNDGDSLSNLETDNIVHIDRPKVLPDILELDIKNQVKNTESSDIDFFQDMEPVIDSSNKFLIDDAKVDCFSKNVSDKLALDVDGSNGNEEDWGNGDWE